MCGIQGASFNFCHTRKEANSELYQIFPIVIDPATYWLWTLSQATTAPPEKARDPRVRDRTRPFAPPFFPFEGGGLGRKEQKLGRLAGFGQVEGLDTGVAERGVFPISAWDGPCTGLLLGGDDGVNPGMKKGERHSRRHQIPHIEPLCWCELRKASHMKQLCQGFRDSRVAYRQHSLLFSWKRVCSYSSRACQYAPILSTHPSLHPPIQCALQYRHMQLHEVRTRYIEIQTTRSWGSSLCERLRSDLRDRQAAQVVARVATPWRFYLRDTHRYLFNLGHADSNRKLRLKDVSTSGSWREFGEFCGQPVNSK